MSIYNLLPFCWNIKEHLWIFPHSRVSVNASERELLTSDLILHPPPQTPSEGQGAVLRSVCLVQPGSADVRCAGGSGTVAAGSLQRDCGNCPDSRRLLRRTDSDSLIDSLVPPTVLHSDPMLTLVSLAYMCLCQQQGGCSLGSVCQASLSLYNCR